MERGGESKRREGGQVFCVWVLYRQSSADHGPHRTRSFRLLVFFVRSFVRLFDCQQDFTVPGDFHPYTDFYLFHHWLVFFFFNCWNQSIKWRVLCWFFFSSAVVIAWLTVLFSGCVIVLRTIFRCAFDRQFENLNRTLDGLSCFARKVVTYLAIWKHSFGCQIKFWHFENEWPIFNQRPSIT